MTIFDAGNGWRDEVDEGPGLDTHLTKDGWVLIRKIGEKCFIVRHDENCVSKTFVLLEEAKAFVEAEILKEQTPWVLSVKGEPGDKQVEIALVHVNFEHGMISWGWDGPEKLVLFDSTKSDAFTHVYKKKDRKIIHNAYVEAAKDMIPILTKHFPVGMF